MSKLLNYNTNMPRTDYPRPQWERDSWYCLNGEWEFAFDFGRSGESRNMVLEGEYPLKITVPFCPESKLSGIGYTDFIPAVWYRKSIHINNIPNDCAILHFGAVDYFCKVWVNGVFCGSHKGGYTSFEIDITKALKAGENIIIVYAEDDNRSGRQPSGKQCKEYNSHDCSYTRTTGIYQTVWLEFVSESYLKCAKITPHASNGTVDVDTEVIGALDGDTLKITAYYKNKIVGEVNAFVSFGHASASLKVDEIHLWDVSLPEIYDLKFELLDSNLSKVKDMVVSYFALRDISLDKKSLKINGKPVFMRMILDQGFNPDGVYTAPTDEFLKRDIELSMQLGFNGARLHTRIFEERTLYWADKLGYIVWGEYAGGVGLNGPQGLYDFLPEWLEAMKQYYNHPALIGWICFNETYHRWELDDQNERMLYKITKMLDPFRPVIDASGGIHYESDMFDVHEYEQDAQKLFEYLEPMIHDENIFHTPIPRYRGPAPVREENYNGQPYWISECGGTLWNPKEIDDSWGYGDTPKNEETFIKRYEDLIDVMLSHPRVCGFCYTQLTDVEQEKNGLYFYDRGFKFSKNVYERIKIANSKKAWIEEN